MNFENFKNFQKILYSLVHNFEVLESLANRLKSIEMGYKL